MGQYNSPPDLLAMLQDMKRRLTVLENNTATIVCTVATRPVAPGPGTIVLVLDFGTPPGPVFEGWTGSEWLLLGT